MQTNRILFRIEVQKINLTTDDFKLLCKDIEANITHLYGNGSSGVMGKDKCLIEFYEK